MPLTRKTPLARTPFKSKAATSKAPARKSAMKSKDPKPKMCKECKQKFIPHSPLAIACSVPCAVEYGRKVSAKQKAKAQREQRAADKAKLLTLRPRKWWVEKAKKAMHLYVRTRDHGKPCCSCDTILLSTGKIGGDYDAGHLRSVGSAKHLEFDPRNVWGQCKDCNMRLNGNEREFERRLRIKEGDEMVDSLMADNQERRLKISDFQEIEVYYKLKLKELKNA